MSLFSTDFYPKGNFPYFLKFFLPPFFILFRYFKVKVGLLGRGLYLASELGDAGDRSLQKKQ